jgi:ABC-type dipeptide/oligopeptide/nickel transport system permease component
MKKYILRRLIQSIPTLFGVIIINFLLIHTAPGDPISRFLGGQEASPEYIQNLRAMFGLDKPLPIQLIIYIKEVLCGNLGYSFASQQPVMKLIMERVPATLLLIFTALIFATLVGMLMGVISSRRPYSMVDNMNTFIALIGYSLPVFWLGQILLITFSLEIRIFPAQGMFSLREPTVGFSRILDVAYHLILPALALSFHYIAINSRFTRASMLEVLDQDYITTARSKGLPEKTIIYKHALRNALLPVVTLIGMNFGVAFAGAVLTETVFAWPGLGRLMLDGIYSRDYPLLMGMFIVISIMVIFSNLITDVIYSLLDPRIRYH